MSKLSKKSSEIDNSKIPLKNKLDHSYSQAVIKENFRVVFFGWILYPIWYYVYCVQEFLNEDLNPDYIKLIKTVASFIKDSGGKVSTVSLPYTKLAIPCYNVLCAAEVSSNMAKLTGLPFGKQVLFGTMYVFETVLYAFSAHFYD